MFKKLQRHWGVTGFQVLLILLTFALGGSLCGYAGRKLLGFTGLDKGAVWVVLYILLVTILWPLCVLLISIPLGQFGFFKKYVGKLIRKLFGKKQLLANKQQLSMPNNVGLVNIAIFASGKGDNAKKIIEYFSLSKKTTVALVVCNKPNAGVMQIASANNIPSLLVERDIFFSGNGYLPQLQQHKIDFIVLAGFLWKMPTSLLSSYQKKIINIHPALLPKFGGKGMYGHYVHEAVIEAKETQSGITIHYVDEVYDHGEIIFQVTCPITAEETPLTLATKIHALELLHFAPTIASILPNQR